MNSTSNFCSGLVSVYINNELMHECGGLKMVN